MSKIISSNVTYSPEFPTKIHFLIIPNIAFYTFLLKVLFIEISIPF